VFTHILKRFVITTNMAYNRRIFWKSVSFCWEQWTQQNCWDIYSWWRSIKRNSL